MPSRHDLTDSLADIIENAERIESYLAGLDRDSFQQDGRTRDAVERGISNRLRHAYDRVNLAIVQNTARGRVPVLAGDARRVLKRLRTDLGDVG